MNKEDVANTHLLGKKLKYVSEYRWPILGDKPFISDNAEGKIFTIVEASVKVKQYHDIDGEQCISVQDDITGITYYDIPVEWALFSYQGEDNPIFVFEGEA